VEVSGAASWYNQPMLISRRFLKTSIVVVIAVAIVAAGTLIWRQQSKVDPKTLFSRAMQANLTESGVTCTIQETANGSLSRQALSLDLAGKTDARAVITLQQKNSSVTTEQISTKDGDFVSYKSIQTTQKSPSGAKLNFDKVLNVWGKNAADSKQTTTLFGRTALGNCVVPLAHLGAVPAANLIGDAEKHSIFKTDPTASKPAKLHGVSVQVYDVTIQPRPYLDFMKQVAQSYGLKDLDVVDPSTFDKKSVQKLKFYINRGSSRIEQITYSGVKHTVTFSDYGKTIKIETPKKTIPAADLQQRLSAVR
jgi:hypothetical protein